MIWPRKLAVSFIIVGALLLAAYLVPTLYGLGMSHVSVAIFRLQNSTNRLWDSARIRAYQRTLGMTFAPPEAVLRIQRLGIEVPVLEGTSDAILNRGIGHISGTALPGSAGNVAVTGHRDGFFRPLKDVAQGDIIEVERQTTPSPAALESRRIDRYVVRKTEVVLPSDLSVLAPTHDATLTLITCYPFYYLGSAPQRFVVHATLVPEPTTSAARTSSPAPFAHPVQTTPGE